MWRRAVIRCGPALRTRCAAQTQTQQRAHALHRSACAPSLLLNTSSSTFHGRHFCTHDKNDDAVPPPPPSVSSETSTASSEGDSPDEYSGAPGVESSGEKFVMVYTCSVCETRSAKTISQHAYYHGVVLVRCPGCENLHLVADRLGWFEDDGTDVESILREKGESVRFVTNETVLELTENDILGKPRKE